MKEGSIVRLILGIGFLFTGIIGNIFAQSRKATPIEVINSDSDELMPLISPDGKTLYFVRTDHPENTGGIEGGQDIWFSIFNPQTATWQEPQNIGPPLNNAGHNAVVGTDSSGTTLWLSNIYLAKSKMAPGLSYALESKKGWSKPRAAVIQEFNARAGFVNFCLATDSILLISMQVDSAHLEDIFVSRLTGEKRWSPPISLGNKINTPGFEIAPFLAADTRTLYFTSDGHPGLGDADIYRSRRLDDTWQNWSEPENLGSQVNTPGFEGYFRVDVAGEIAYFGGDSPLKDDLDIYMVRLSDLAQPENNTGIAAINQEVKVKPSSIQPAEIVPFQIQFETGSARLTTPAEMELNNFLVTVPGRASNRFIIAGHADDTGDAAFNQQISRERAQTVATYLQSKGIHKTKIEIQAWSNSRPLAPNTSEHNRALNRRVQVIVTPE